MNCLSRILRQTNWNGLTFKNVTAGDWYKELMIRQGSILNVGIGKSELLIEEAMMGYALCYQMNGANSSAELKMVVQGKYYRHLEKICGKIIERFEDRNGRLVDLANSLIEWKELMSGAQLSAKKMCEEWKGLTMYKCVGMRFNVSGDWDSVFQVYRDRFVEIDGYITEGLKLSKESCSKGLKSKSGLTEAYAGLVTFNLEVTEIAKAYNHEIGLLKKLRLLVNMDTDSSELQICVSQTVGRSLTDKEATFVLLQIYNAKIRAFRRIFPAGAREVGNFDVFETQRILLRNKRYIWTE